MKGLQQKTPKRIGASLQKRSAEHGRYATGFTSIWMTENNTVTPSEEDGLLGQVLNPYNQTRLI